MAAGDSYRFVGNATYQNNTYQTTLCFQMASAATVTNALIQPLAEFIKGRYRGFQTSQVTWTEWSFTQLWGAAMTVNPGACTRSGGLVFTGTFTAPNNGSISTGEPLPPQCAAVITLVTGFAGRRKRGRNYAFGLNETNQGGGTWDPSFVTSFQTTWNDMITTYGASGTDPNFTLIVWSERTASGCVPNPSGHGHINVDTPSPETASTEVISAIVRPTVFTQRRRVLGVGR